MLQDRPRNCGVFLSETELNPGMRDWGLNEEGYLLTIQETSYDIPHSIPIQYIL